jgi:hypothetical protein
VGSAKSLDSGEISLEALNGNGDALRVRIICAINISDTEAQAAENLKLEYENRQT